MNIKVIILMAIVTLAILGNMTSPVSAQTVEYTPTTMTTCDGGTCTKSLFSGTMFVQKDDVWKPVEQAESLKNYWDIIWLENDTSFLFQDFEYNYTSFFANLSFNGNWSNYLGQCTEKNNSDVTCTFKLTETHQEWNDILEDYDEIEIEYEYEWEYENGTVTSEKQEFRFEGNPLSRQFTFGGNSTVIQLQDANSENLNDTYIRHAVGFTTREHGARTTIRIGGTGDVTGTLYSTLIKLSTNSTQLPSNVDIINSTLCMNVSSNFMDGGDELNYSINRVYPFPTYSISGREWVEGNGTAVNGEVATIPEVSYSTKPDATQHNTTYDDILGFINTSEGWHCWNTTSSIKIAYANDDENTTFWIKHNASRNIGAGDFITFQSKENTQVSARPYLNITYQDKNQPKWFTNQSSTTATYNPDPTFQFNITWNTTDTSLSNISWVYIETNLTGTATNYTATNNTYGGDIFNYTFLQPFIPAQYYWKSWANETLNDYWNETDTFLFTIGQNASNPLTISFTTDGSTATNTDISTTSATTVTIDGGTDFENSGSVTIFVNATQLAPLPDARTRGVGIYDVKINTTGNSNYTANGTGVTYTMTVTSGVSTGGGTGGGGASPFTVIVSDACNVTVVPRFGLSGSSSTGSEIAPFTVLVLNKNVTQTFTAEISGEADIYCDVRFAVIEPIPPFGSQRFVIDCTAPNGTASGNLVISSDLGCSFGVPITVSSSTGIFAEVSNVIKLFVSGEFVAAITSTILNVPVWIWLIVIISLIILFLILR